MDFSLEMNSPAGMVQLIKYFESQSERLDKQTIQPQSACLGSSFESLIKFNGVPILPPAMTASRREKFRQLKREAVFREKRQRARQRRTSPKQDFPSADSKDRPTARQLNFDSDQPSEETAPSSLHHRLGATNPLSTFATAETEGNTEDFGMRTIDSLSSEFVSLEEGTLPTSFSGHTLKSVKEQKISFNLDHLCKELKIPDLGSTSGSDLSDALQNTNTFDGDLMRGERWAEKIITHNVPNSGGQVQMTSFCHDSQDTVVEVSPEAGISNHNADNGSSSGFGDKSEHSNLEQTQTSIGSSPGCGSTTTTDSQKSKVHFASFIYEYNTSASQSFDSTAIVKKKMSPDNAAEDESKAVSRKGHGVTFSSSYDTKHRGIPTNKTGEGEGAGGLLNRVSLQPDSESSPGTPPFDVAGVPFRSYTRNDSYNSDKENEEHRATKVSPKPGITKHEASASQLQPGNNFRSHGLTGSAARRLNLNNHQYGNRESRNKDDGEKPHGSDHLTRLDLESTDLSQSDVIGETSVSCDSSDLVSVSQISLMRPAGVLSLGKSSVSDSNASSKSLTATSESSSSTIKEDLTPKESNDLGLNIVGTDNSQGNSHNIEDKDGRDVNESADIDPGSPSTGHKTTGSNDREAGSPKELIHSPKKLNVTHQLHAKESTENPSASTPSKTHVRRGSYTLSEPSPILIQAKSRLEAERKRKAELADDKAEVPKTYEAPDQDNQSSLQKRLDFDDAQEEAKVMTSVPSDPEKEGKAEHINRYLSQVQFQNSMNLHSQSLDHESDENQQNEDVPYQEFASNSSVIDVLRSIAESTGSLGQISDVELQSLQQQQMELARKALVEQQNKDMEELFIQQRKEIMMFETEIKVAQQQHLEHHKFLVHNAPENIKVKARNHKEEYSPESSGNFNEALKQGSQGATSIKNSMNSLDNMRQRPVSRSFQSESQGASGLNLQPKVYPGLSGKSPLALNIASSNSQNSNKQNSSFNMLSMREQTYVKTVDEDFPPSNSMPKRVMDPVGLASQIPDFSSPSVNSPRMHRNIMFKSPHLFADIQRKSRQVVVPPEAFQPGMKAKFDRVSAVAKGFLTRCLLRSDKVQELIKTIKDTREFAFDFQTETPIKKGVFTAQDRGLLERIIAQLQAALLDIHEIFFEIPSAERMSLIEHTRMVEYDKRMKASRDSTRSSGPRISQATLKALERKRKAREAEASAILSSTSRPKSASSSSSSPRCQGHNDMRVLKPLQGQSHASFHNHSHSSSSDKDRPQTAPEKQLTRPKRMSVQTSKPAQSSVITTSESSKESNKEVNKKTTVSSTAKTVAKSKVAPSKPASGRSTKSSWR